MRRNFSKYVVTAMMSAMVCIAHVEYDAGASNSEITLDVTDGDNITSDLQKAVKEYKVINIPAGSYKCEAVKINNIDGVTINADDCTIEHVGTGPLLSVSEGAKSSNITVDGGVWNGGTNGNVIVRLNGKTSDITLKNMTVENAVDGVRAKATDGLILDNVTSKDNEGYGVILTGVKNAVVRNSTVNNNGDNGMALADCTNTKVSDTVISYNGGTKTKKGHGVYVTNGTASFTNVVACSNYWCGIVVTGKGATATLTGCETSNNGKRPDSEVENVDSVAAGVGVYSGADVTVIESTCSNNYGSGIVVASRPTTGKAKVLVMGCTIADNGDHGIGGHPYAIINLKASANGTRNTISGSRNNGILYSDHCSSSYIMNTDISSSGNMGISFIKKSVGKNISDCNSVSNKQDGLRLTDSCKITGTVKNCNFSKNGRSGIGIYKNSQINKVYGCKVSSNKNVGIRVSDKNTQVSIEKTTISNNRKEGISVSDRAKVTNLKRCTIVSNKMIGFCLRHNASLVKASGNTIKRNKVYQVYIQKGCKSKLKTKKK